MSQEKVLHPEAWCISEVVWGPQPHTPGDRLGFFQHSPMSWDSPQAYLGCQVIVHLGP